MRRGALVVIACSAILSCGQEPTASENGVRERWHRPQPGYGHARPVVVGDLVYFGTGDGQQLVEVTQPHTNDPLFASPAAYHDGRIFVTLIGAARSFDEP